MKNIFHLIQKSIPRSFYVGLYEVQISRKKSHLVGMTTISEQQWYRKIAGDYSESQGKIVDLGSWMGSTAISLARGLKDVSTQGSIKRVYAIDRYIWEDWMSTFSFGLQCEYLPGESFLPEVR